MTDYCFFKRKFLALWTLFTLNSLSGSFKFNFLFLDILLVLIGIIIPYTRFTGLNNIFYIYIYIYIYICIYIYIVIHRQTVSFYQNSPESKPIQLYVRLSLRPLGQQAYHVWLREFLRYYVVTAAAVCLHFHTLSATKVLNSFEELCIMRDIYC